MVPPGEFSLSRRLFNHTFLFTYSQVWSLTATSYSKPENPDLSFLQVGNPNIRCRRSGGVSGVILRVVLFTGVINLPNHESGAKRINDKTENPLRKSSV